MHGTCTRTEDYLRGCRQSAWVQGTGTADRELSTQIQSRGSLKEGREECEQKDHNQLQLVPHWGLGMSRGDGECYGHAYIEES